VAHGEQSRKLPARPSRPALATPFPHNPLYQLGLGVTAPWSRSTPVRAGFFEVSTRRSFSEQLDTSTPAGKMVFTVLGAVAELERSLIVERVKAGLRNARAKGKRLGRPRVAVDAAQVARLRAYGFSWPKIARELGVSVGTAYQAAKP
jgi:hypothetical protein